MQAVPYLPAFRSIAEAVKFSMTPFDANVLKTREASGSLEIPLCVRGGSLFALLVVVIVLHVELVGRMPASK